MAIRFTAEIVEIKAKKAASLDKVFRLVFETNSENVIELQKFIATEPVEIEVKEVDQ